MVRLDRAIADEQELSDELGECLGGTVTEITVQQLDLVNDSKHVDVRYRVTASREKQTQSVAESAASR